MRQIRIKVKYLLISLVLILGIGITLFNFSDKILFSIGSAYETKDKNEVADAYYKRIVEKFPQRDSAIIAANRQIESLLENLDMNFFNDNVTLDGSSSSKGGSNISIKSLKDINEDYKAIVKHHKENDKLARYTIGVALMNWFAGEYNQAIDLIEDIDYIIDEELESIRAINLASMYMNIGNIKKGIKALEPQAEEYDIYKFLRRDVLAYGYFMIKDMENFKEHLTERTIMYENEKQLKDPYIKSAKAASDIVWYMDDISKIEAGTNNRLEGRVTMEGKPLPYVLVAVKEKKYRYMSSSRLDAGSGWDITDENGYYSIEGMPNGEYGITINVDWQRIQGKAIHMNDDYNLKFTGNTQLYEDIEFKDNISINYVKTLEENMFEIAWDDYEDVDYYTMRIGEIRETEGLKDIVIFNYYSDRIDNNHVILDVEEESQYAGLGGTMSWGMDGIDPYYVLEPLYHTGTYAFVVTGYNKDGNIVADSMGIFSNRLYDTISIKGKDWTDADKLLIERNYEEAIKAYEEELEENPEDLHSIKALAKLYYYGWEYQESGRYMKGRDLEKAKMYYEVLGKVFKDSSYVKNMLAELYTLEKNYGKALDIYSQLTEGDRKYLYHNIGNIYVYLHQWDKAIENYNKYLETTSRDATMPQIIMIQLLQNNLQEAKEVATKFKGDYFVADFPFIIDRFINEVERTEYEEFYNLIKEGQVQEADIFLENREDNLAKLYKGIRLLQTNMNKDIMEKEYTDIYETVGIEPYKTLMKYFGKSSLNTGFGERY